MTTHAHHPHFVITGGGTGIGRAIAHRLSRDGARLTLIGRRREPLERVRDELSRPGLTPLIVTADIRTQAEVDAAFETAARTHGPIHGLIANAGLGGENRAGADDRFDDIVSTNLNGSYYSLRAFERFMAPGAEPRHVVVIASILARFGVAGYTGYCASKAGLLGLVRAAALELAPRNVMVNALCPGWVSTEMAWQGIDGFASAAGLTRDQAFAEAMKAVPLGRMSEPEDVANLVGWLVSAECRGVTGQTLDINNGAWMG